VNGAGRTTGSAAALLGAMVLGPGAPTALALAGHERADAPAAVNRRSSTAHAPAGGSLVTPLGPAEAEQPASPERTQADPLVANGLGSPACGSPLSPELSGGSRRDCETAGFTAAGAPTGNFGLDVHIDTGLIPLTGGGLLTTVQDLFVAPLWLAVVWLVHVLVVMLEWSFGLDLIEGASARGLQANLSHAGRVLTAPLLALALSIAAGLVAYHGLVRRRVGQTLGEALAMLAMIGGGTWLMVDPAGTVGALSAWTGEAGLGALAAAADGAPAAPGRALAQSMSTVFAATVEAPWCYLEFGDVAWCREPSRLERSLHLAGLRLADREQQEANCGGSSCAGGSRLLNSARLLREARTNGDEFLALAPNGPERNSINDTSSLLRTLCRSSDATSCNGPGASEAEFRTNSGTWPRVGGLMLILIGVLGMLLLLGWIGLRLLLAAILSLFYLLLTPGIVLVPVFGESGRSAFRGWAGRLFGAVLAKLVYAFLLGVVLSVMSVLEALSGLGWWADWMLQSAFWWGAYLKRHEILARAPSAARGATLTVKTGRSLRLRRELRDLRARGDRDRRNSGSGEGVVTPARPQARRLQATRIAAPSGGSGPSSRDGQAMRLIAARGIASAVAPQIALATLAAKRAQLGRVQRAKASASAAGDRRRVAKLTVREARVEQELDRHAEGAPHTASAPRHERGEPATEVSSAGAMLDRQAELPAAVERARGEPRRDYPALAGLVGLTRERYAGLHPQGQRQARLEIDRELSARRAARGVPGTRGAGNTEQEGAVKRPAAPHEHVPRVPQPQWRESAVMRDAREVAEGRKKELGFDRS
jgi:hypothetical protein